MSQPQPQAKCQSTATNQPGRPPFLTDVKRAEICAVVAAGCSFRTAAKYVGCKVQAISALAQRDREFGAQLDRAVAQREVIPLSHIREASKHSWRAAAWLLEKTVGGRYGGDVKTLEEEAAAEESEEFATAIGQVHRAYDEQRAPDIPATVVEVPVADEPIVDAPEFGEQPPASEVQASGLEEFMRGSSAADHDERNVATMLSSLSPEAEPNATAANTKTSAKTSNSAASRRAPTETARFPAALTPGALLSESISPQSILESMQAPEASWRERPMEA